MKQQKIVRKRLTPAQRRAIKSLLPDGNFAILHYKARSTCYRILTRDRVPVCNVREHVFNKIKGWYTDKIAVDVVIPGYVANAKAKAIRFKNN